MQESINVSIFICKPHHSTEGAARIPQTVAAPSKGA
jgi:hypothetical protein